MMSPELHSFFEAFGTEKPGIDLPASNTVEQNAIALAQHYQKTTPPGQGIFFDLEATPELKQPTLNYLVERLGWTLEKPYFIRKPRA